jgi:NTP pyrophosphatase (non-canonical NTP hydrolase)
MTNPEIQARWQSAVASRAVQVDDACQRFRELLGLMADLRSNAGCPWDREQSLGSLRQYIEEEAGEVKAAIDAALAYEDELRIAHGMRLAEPEAPCEPDRARTSKKGLSIAHHPHRDDFSATQSASGAPMPADLDLAEREHLGDLYNQLSDEIGDFFLQAMFLGDILFAMGRGGVERPLQLIIEKLIRRHPHVYGGISAADSAEVLSNWERIKAAENGRT